MDYRIIEASSERKLEKKVKELISDNWVPQGGVCISHSYPCSDYYAQAMIKVPPNDK